MAYNKKNVLEANTEAIRVVLRLEKERREATEAEKSILRDYQGFGGLKCVLNRTDTPDDIRYWSKSEQNLFEPTQQLKQMIYREAIDANTAKRYWESIKASVLTSFYTDTRIVTAISDALTSVNVSIRRCLDPSAGMGAFAETFARQAGVVDAMEKDLLTARISQALHPYGKGNVFVRNEPFEAIGELEDKDKYDLITSNIPFGDFMVYDREYSKGKDTLKRESTRAIHNYFFVKGLDCIKEGGLLAFITSQGVLDMEESDIISSLEGRIYYNPEENVYEVADKFISGNVIEKAERIESWLLDHPDHEEAKQSLAALRAATPTPIPFADLDFNLGERWIPAKVYGRFASEFFGTDIGVSYHSNMDEYSIVCDRKNANIWHKYAVQGEFRRYDGINFLKHALHNTIPDINKSKEVTDKVTGETKTIKVRDGHAIQMANAKIEEIRQGFVDWLGRTPDTFKQQLSDRYNRLFNCFVRPNFDGTHQTFPDLDLRRLGIADLYKSQKDAVWMLKTNGGGICDHEVGAGKTLIMCTAAYEMKRLGLANKPMIIGLKANVFDIADTFRKAYPNAKVLYPGKNDFNKQNRQRIFNDIKNNDWDCIILTHEQFGMIPQALEIQEAILQKEMDSVEENLEVLRQQGHDISRAMLKGLEKRKQTLEAKLQGIQDGIAERKDDAVDFKMMGIDHLFVDESH